MLPAPISVRKLPSPALHFPPAWTWLVDEMLPAYVKSHYSPREGWKDKPFTKDDVRFFSKGVKELSELFTEDRPEKIPAYFQHPKFRSAYLLYFLPLQMAKFVTLYEMHDKAIEAALAHGRKAGVLRVSDLGAGPGTASMGLLLRLLEKRPDEVPPIELQWFDTQRTIMEDGKTLALAIADQFPRLRGKVKIEIHAANWWDAPAKLPEQSLILLGHVLNEARTLPNRFKAHDEEPELDLDEENENTEQERTAQIETVWSDLLSKACGGGILFVEPASKVTSQFLSRLRNRIFDSKTIEKTATRLWGPCPHAETCPLSYGKDYCHFSVPTRIPGKWFAEFSKALGSERLWLKFSYLWITAENQPSAARNPKHKLVISDPLSKTGEVLICEPVRPGRVITGAGSNVWRGDVITSDASTGEALKPKALQSAGRDKPTAPRAQKIQVRLKPKKSR